MATQITSSEVNELKNIFQTKMSENNIKCSIVYSQDENGEEDLKAYNGTSGIDAMWSGFLSFSNDYSLNWEFSLREGVTIKESTFKINVENKNLTSTLFDIYEIWSDKLESILNSNQSNTPEQSVPSEEIIQGAENLAEFRNVNERQKVINESSERMKKLAGLN